MKDAPIEPGMLLAIISRMNRVPGPRLQDTGPRPASGASRGRTLGFWAASALALIIAVGASGRSSSAQSQQFGLEWPGNGSVRRMLYWSNPFPIYPATYIFRVFPRKKIVPTNSPTGYYTTFFWGNNGDFVWQGGGANTYYGAHPYPALGSGPPNGIGSWEISVRSIDPTTGVEVSWDRWHQQAFVASRQSSTITNHQFYYDLPDTSKLLSQQVVDSGWASQNPPNPAIVIGQAP